MDMFVFFGPFLMPYFAISGYHTDQKHANQRIVVTGLESGGNIQLFTVCLS